MKEAIPAALAFALGGSFLLSLLPGGKKGISAALTVLFSLSLLSLVLGPVLSLREVSLSAPEESAETSFAEGDRSWILEETAKQIGREVTAYLREHYQTDVEGMSVAVTLDLDGENVLRVKAITIDLRASLVTFDIRALKSELSDLLDTPVTVLVR
ncbi:MAG: hypothetical protein IJR89_04435 [Clostridia bacterium]|nr:hypothetical protein [Clostridia bacterium]